MTQQAPNQANLLKPANYEIIDDILINKDYCYHTDDVYTLLSEIVKQASAHQKPGQRVALVEPIFQLGNRKTKNSLTNTLFNWIDTKPFNQLLLVPFMPDEQHQGAQTILHWMGLVANANQKGEISLSFIDPLHKNGQKMVQQKNSWQSKIDETLRSQQVPFQNHAISIQQQDNGTLLSLIHI